ncbi:MAG: hypothetical protein Q7U91_16370 [Sideroxyarcus sp.]|nr:hypothetical protein [Sideroxyarcus sp.]
MIEISLQLKLDSFLVNSMGKSEDISSQKSARALKLTCEQILSGRLMTESKPTTDFEFLGSASKHETQLESDTDFDGKLITHLKTHTAIHHSRVNIASGLSGYVAAEKGVSSGEIGRLYIAELSNQNRLGIELVLKPEEFDAAWELMTQQKVRRVAATLVCFKLMPGAFVDHAENLFAAGILSCSLQFTPND